MSIAASVQQHLDRTGVFYDLVPHKHSHSSLESARVASVPAEQVIKAVLTHDGNNYQLCLLPASRHLDMTMLDDYMCGHFELAMEDDLELVFDDCERGAVPALGQVYGFHVVWDDALAEQDDLYMEAGDHRHLIHLTRGAFMELMGRQDHAPMSQMPEDDTRH